MYFTSLLYMYLGVLQDYKTYLDFVLALENRRAPQSLQYFMRLLDINHKGHLNAFDLNYFFRVSTAYKIILYTNGSINHPLFFREENVAGLFALNTGLDLYTTVTVVS